MATSMRRSGLLLACALLSACSVIPLPTVGGQSVALERKTVHGKHTPRALVAEDGTECQVSADRYKDVVRGEQAWCIWK
jgi:hypothetical protein